VRLARAESSTRAKTLFPLDRTVAMETLWQDTRFAVRTLLKNPTFTVAAVLTLALGIGMNATIFSVVNAILIRPMPHVDSERLVVLRETSMLRGQETELSYPDFSDWRAESRSFAAMGAYYDRRVIVTGPSGEPAEIEVEMVTPNLLGMLGARPSLGRLFLPEEGEPGRGDVAIVADVFWREQLGSDPGVVGRTIALNGAPHTIVGVMPPRFGFPDNQPIWVPIAQAPDPATRGHRYLRVVGRLAPGATPQSAQAELESISRRLAERYPETNAGIGARVVDFDEAWAGEVRPVLLLMLGAVGFVLLIACSNVANLMLTRAAARQREIALRAALGAGRGRLARQLLTESVVVALLGGALGVLLAYQGIRLIMTAFPFTPPLWMVFDIDRNVLLYTLALSLGTGLLFGIVPALRATGASLTSTLREGGRGLTPGRGGGRVRSILIVAQLALATVLLAGAVLMIRSFLKLQHAEPGFETASVLTVRITTGGDRYTTAEARNLLFQQVVERAAELPGVGGVAVTSILPLSGSSATSSVRVEDRPVPPGEEPSAEYRGISAAFFDVLGVPMLSGRAPTPLEVETGATVAVINRTFADRYWPGESALGRSISAGGPTLTVIGVSHDIRMGALNERPTLQLFAPHTLRAPGSISVLLRAADPAALTLPLREVVRGIDAGVTFSQVLVMQEVVRRSLWRQRLFGGLFTAFGGIALLLAVTGIYGVVGYSVARRTHEVGVRMALGAGTGRVLRMVTGEGLRLATIGVGIGLLASLGLMRLLASQLYGVGATDPVTLGATAAILVGAALAASYLPARRATRIDPMIALRTE
jgi:putative ABC transport system permease protein